MRFFDQKRVEVFLHSPKLRRDKKTNCRLWSFTLIVTFSVELAESCEAPIAKAWAYITERDSAAFDVQLVSEIEGCAIDFFANIDDAEPVLHLEGVDLVGLRLTRSQNLVEFWFSGEHENSEKLHAFMKPFAYTRLWAQFSPAQGDLELKPRAEPGGVQGAAQPAAETEAAQSTLPLGAPPNGRAKRKVKEKKNAD